MSFDPQTIWRYARLNELRRVLEVNPQPELSSAERAELARWRCLERREEWILARALARQLIAAQFIVETGEPAIEICSRDSLGRGVRPVVTIAGHPLSGTISISHTRSAVLVAISATPDITIGVDLVQKTALGTGFWETWFDDLERRNAESGDALETCRLWAAKEAVYKAVNQNDPFTPRQISLRGGERGVYRCSYRGVDLGDHCQVTVWDCDDHVAALAILLGRPALHESPVGVNGVPGARHTNGPELLTSLRTEA